MPLIRLRLNSLTCTVASVGTVMMASELASAEVLASEPATAISPAPVPVTASAPVTGGTAAVKIPTLANDSGSRICWTR